MKIGDKVLHRGRPDVGVGQVVEITNDDLCTVEFDHCRFSGVPLDAFATIEEVERERRESQEKERRRREQIELQKLADARTQEQIKRRQRIREDEKRRQELAEQERARENANKAILDRLSHREIRCFWYITHKANLKSILKRGILNHYDASRLEPNRFDISDPDAQRWREEKDPHFKRTIHSYAPLYINPKNPMLYVRREIRNSLLLLEVQPSVLFDTEYLITDGNAASRITNFYKSVDSVDKLPWDVLKGDYWPDFQDGKRKMCSEVLVYPKVDPQYIAAVHCYSRGTKASLGDCERDVFVSPKLFF